MNSAPFSLSAEDESGVPTAFAVVGFTPSSSFVTGGLVLVSDLRSLTQPDGTFLWPEGCRYLYGAVHCGWQEASREWAPDLALLYVRLIHRYGIDPHAVRREMLKIGGLSLAMFEENRAFCLDDIRLDADLLMRGTFNAERVRQ
jgi:hypothetical protein